MRRRWPRSVRARLALWHGLALLLVVSVYALAVLWQVRDDLYEELDRQLEGDIAWTQSVLGAVSANGSTWQPREAAPTEAFRRAASRLGRELPWIDAWTLDGRPLFSSGRPSSLPAELLGAPGPVGRSETLRLPHGHRVRARTERVSVGGAVLLVRVARTERQAIEELWEFGTALLVSLPFAFAVAAGAGYLLARRALAPVGAMAARARQITADHLAERLPVEDPADEFGQLATVVNEALARIEQAFATLKRFTADASHELRTPLTAIRAVGEVGLRQPRDAAEYREIIGSVLEEADRLARLVDSLLTLSRADAGRADLERVPVELRDLARDVMDELEVLSEEKRQDLRLEGAADVLVMADRGSLRQALMNLLDNAVKYSPEHTVIRIVVGEREGAATIDVIDQGPGIPGDARPRIFDRFSRVDQGRSRDAGGVGLGLAIARWAVEANHGQLELASASEAGSDFRITLPASNVRSDLTR